MIVRELVTRLGFDANDTAVRRYDRSFVGLQRRANSLLQTINPLNAALGALAATLSLRTLQQTADQVQSLEARLGQLPQIVGDTGEAFERLAVQASDARLSLNGYGQVFNRIGQATQDYIKTEEDLTTVVNTLSRALIVGGATAAEQESAFLQFSQALGAGTLQGEEFRAMAEAAPQFLTQLAKELDVPRSALKEMGSQGQLTTEEVIKATMRMADFFEDRFEDIPLTIGQAFTISGNIFSTMIAKLNRETRFVEGTAHTIVRAATIVGDAVTATAKVINDLVQSMGGWENVARAVRAALIVLGGRLVLSGINGLAAALTAAGGAAALLHRALLRIPIYALLVGLTLLVDDLWSWANGQDSVVGRALGSWEGFKKDFMGVLEDLKFELSEVWGVIGDIMTGDWESALDRMDEATDRFKATIESLWGDLADWMRDQMKDLLPDWAVNLLGLNGQPVAPGPAPTMATGDNELVLPDPNAPVLNRAPSTATGDNALALPQTGGTQGTGVGGTNRDATALGGVTADNMRSQLSAGNAGGGTTVNQRFQNSFEFQLPAGSNEETRAYTEREIVPIVERSVQDVIRRAGRSYPVAE